jgi:type II secretory pathway pseudopilin PulG
MGPGFSLIEVAIAVFVITLLLGGILVPRATQVEQRKISETQKALDEIRDALLGFALANGYLPCPDKTAAGGAGTENDGQEDVIAASGTCVATGNEGNLPWVTLGAGISDVWGIGYMAPLPSGHRARGSISARSAILTRCRHAPVPHVRPHLPTRATVHLP